MSREDKKTSGRAPKQRIFYLFGPDITGGGKGHGLVFENANALRIPPRVIVRPAEGGFPAFKEKPRIVYDRKKGKPPRDLEASLSGYWFVSERLKNIFEQAAPDGFLFAEYDYILPDGSLGPSHYLCEIASELDALDLERSKLKLLSYKEAPGVQYYSIGEYGGRPELYFKDEVVGGSLVFRQLRLGADPVCDSSVREACKACPDLKGVRFRRADKL